MTRIYGYALDPESGQPRPGRQVRAYLWPSTRATLQGPAVDGADTVSADEDGRWELNLLPTVGSGRVIRLRCTGCFTVYADIPAATSGGAGDVTAIDVATLLVDPTTLDPIPHDPSVYLPRALLGVASGVASLGSDGILTAAQRPPGGQPLDSDLTAIAALAPADGSLLQRVAGVWNTITTAALKTALALVKGDVGLGNVDNTADASKNSATATLTNKTLTSPVVNSPTGIVKADVGLGLVDNTSDATKNSASATLTNKTLTAPVVNSPTGMVKGDVGLGSVDNTADTAKPVSAAQQTALDGKAPLASPALTGTPTAPTQTAGSNSTRLATTAYADAAASAPKKLADASDFTTTAASVGQVVSVIGTGPVSFGLSDTSEITPGSIGAQPADSDLTTIAGLVATTDNFMVAASSAWASRTPSQAKTALALVKGDVGLGSADNTADTAKPVSTAQQTVLDAKAAKSANLSDLASASTARTNLGLGGAAVLAVGTTAGTVAAGDDSRLTVPSDAELTALAGLVSAANKLPYFTGSGTASLADLTAAGRALVDDADASAQLTTLGVSTFIKTLLDDTDAATARVTLGKVLENRGYASGQYYFPTSPHGASTGNALGNGTLRLVPWIVPEALTIVRIGAEITTVGESGSKFRPAIYSDDGTGYPGALLLDPGQIAGDSATVQEITVSRAVPAGIYWIGGAVQSAPTTQPTVRTMNNSFPPIPLRSGASVPGAGSTFVGYSQASVTGALPSNFTATVTVAGTIPRLFVKTS